MKIEIEKISHSISNLHIQKNLSCFHILKYPQEYQRFCLQSLHGKKTGNRMSASIHGVAFMEIKLLSSQ